MTIGKICAIVGEASQIALQTGFLDPAGNLVPNPSIEVITQTASRVEQVIKDAGVAIPSNVELILRLIPLLIPILENSFGTAPAPAPPKATP